MTDIRPLQQKAESATDARANFERGLEELMRGHLDDCMSYATCSSARNTEDEDEESDQLVRRRRRSDLEGDDLAESSAARRRHSRRWAARQAQEMITTIERRNRESELMALAGLHPVSMLDYSFLRESQSPNSRRSGTVERPSTRASAILQMWRELEDDHELNRARERVRERLRHQRSMDSNTDVSTITMSESRADENQGSVEDASESEQDFGAWSHDQMEIRNEQGNTNHSSREQSPDLGEVERERVRQIVRGWMESGISERSSDAAGRINNPRGEWLGETERERVRLVREWVHASSQQRTRGGRTEDQLVGLGAEVNQVHGGLVRQEEGQTEHIRRDLLRLRGRQALIDLLMRIERERQRELQGLLDQRAVTDFAHRNRIQSFLRGRFLRTERTTEDERPPSVAASELLQLRQRNTVSDLRKNNRAIARRGEIIELTKMADNKDAPSSAKPPPAPPSTSSSSQRPTITLPSRAGIESLFTGSGIGLSPGPMTLVSNFFSENDPDSDCRSFSQLLAGAMASPRPPSEPDQLRFKDNRPSVLVISPPPQPPSQQGGAGGGGFFMLSPGISPATLLDSPGLFPGQGPFGMSHQQALAQVTAQAVQAQANLHMQGGFQSSLALGPSASEPFPGFAPDSSMQKNITSSAHDSRDIKESAQVSGSDQRSQYSSIIVDKPADDGYNWRKYGQKQVKGSEYPRSYYKCTHAGCPVKKKVERSLDGQVTEIIYKGQHNHQPPQKRSKDSGNNNENLGTQGNPESVSQPQASNLNSTSDSMAYSLHKRDQESSQATTEQLSSDEEEVGNGGTREAEGDEDEPNAKRRITEVRVTEQAASHRTVTEPRIIVQTTSEVDLLDDGYRWRKYGQKVVKGNPYPRSYYKCTYAGCNVRKHVERAASDPKAVITTYEGKHDHDVPAARMSSHNTANSSSQLRPHNSAVNTNSYAGKTEFTNTHQQPVALLRLKEERIT